MTVRNSIDSPRRLVLLLALCTSLTYPQIYASDCCACDEKRGIPCPIKAPQQKLFGEHAQFNGVHIPEKQDHILGYGEDYCIGVMRGKKLIVRQTAGEEDENDLGYICECEADHYMAFFGMCISMADGRAPWATVEIDGVTFGRDPSYARFLPPANEDGLDDYSFFADLISGSQEGTFALYIAHAYCSEWDGAHMVSRMYDNAAYDYVCTCDEDHFMNQKGKCVASCDNPSGSGRLDDNSQYCWD